MKMLLVAAALALSVTTTSAQQLVDPYAKTDREALIKNYLTNRETAFNKIRYVFLARGCLVLHNNGAEGISMILLRESGDGWNYIPDPRAEVQRVRSRYETAKQEGLNKARVPGTCDVFRDHPDEVRRLREMQDRVVRSFYPF